MLDCSSTDTFNPNKQIDMIFGVELITLDWNGGVMCWSYIALKVMMSRRCQVVWVQEEDRKYNGGICTKQETTLNANLKCLCPELSELHLSGNHLYFFNDHRLPTYIF